MPDFEDQFVIYWSDADEAFVAHSLKTDQIGVGTRVLDALAELLRALETLQQVAADDPSVNVFCEAPVDIQALAKDAEKLPLELYEIAYKMAHGEWPSKYTIDIEEQADLAEFARRRFLAESRPQTIEA